MPRARSVVDVILGEAVSGTPQQRYQDMVAIASAMVNRANKLGVPLEDVVSVRSEFNAYGRSLPAGVDRYRDLAERALTDVLTNGPVHPGSFYATPAAKGNLPKGLSEVTRTTGHVYFEDPHDRSIRTAQGFRSPVAQAYSVVPQPRPEPEAFAALLGPVEPSFAAPVGGVERGSMLGPVDPARSSMELPGSPAIEVPAQSAFPSSPAFDSGRFAAGPVANGRSDLAKGLTASTPAFDMGRFGPQIATPTAPSSFDVGRFAETAPVAQGYEGLLSAMQPAFDTARFGAVAGPTPADPTRAGLQRGLLDQQLSVGILPDIPAPIGPAAPSALLGPAAVNPSPYAAVTAYVDPKVSAQPREPQPTPAITTVPAQPARPAVGTAARSPSPFGRAAFGSPYGIGSRLGLTTRDVFGTVGGAILGGALLGPVGGLLGGLLGREITRPATTLGYGGQGAYPSAPAPMSASEAAAFRASEGSKYSSGDYAAAQSWAEANPEAAASPGLY